MALDATPKGASSNSYVTRDDADSYFAERLHADVWTSASNGDKDAALIWATRILDQQVNWAGSKRTEEQALRWPRSGVSTPDGYWLDYDTIPTFLEQATAELAMLLISSDRTLESDTQGFSAIRVGPISLTVDKRDRIPVIPDGIISIIAPYGDVENQNGANVVRLLRA